MGNMKEKSLLEVVVELMERKRTAQNIYSLIKEALEIKGLTDEDGSLTAQVYVDITTSSKFVYMGDEEWDLKSRQSLDQFDKDGSAFNSKDEEYVEDEEIDDLDEDDLDDSDYDEDDDLDEDDEESDDDDYDVEFDEDDYDDEESDTDDDDDLDDEPMERYDEEFDEDKYNDYMDDFENMYED